MGAVRRDVDKKKSDLKKDLIMVGIIIAALIVGIILLVVWYNWYQHRAFVRDTEEAAELAAMAERLQGGRRAAPPAATASS